MLQRRLQFTRLQIVTHIGGLFTLAWLIWDYVNDNLTVNPIQDITFRTGKYALVLLILSLACTPISTVFGFRRVLRLRRALGLYAFMYVSVHFLIFVGLDYRFDWALLQGAIFEKRYALVGFAAFLILLPLAITSTQGWMRRLRRNWKRLHRMVYVAALLAIVHYVWLVKADIRKPLAYGSVVVVLLILRAPPVRAAAISLRRRLREKWDTKTIGSKSLAQVNAVLRRRHEP